MHDLPADDDIVARLPKNRRTSSEEIFEPPCDPVKNDASSGEVSGDSNEESSRGSNAHLGAATPLELQGAGLKTQSLAKIESYSDGVRIRHGDYGPLDEPRPTPIHMLPGPARKKSYGLLLSFIAFVCLPTIAVAIYYFHYAADQYIAEFRFAVFQSQPFLPGQTPPTSGDSSSLASGLSSLSVIAGAATSATGASTQNYLVIDYLKSRSAVNKVDRQLGLKSMFSSAPTTDWWSRFPTNGSDEDLYKYWLWMLDANYDQVTGIAKVQVRAFSPEDALKISKTLVTMSEDMINTVANRSNTDAVRFAEAQAQKAKARLDSDNKQLKQLRDSTGVIDPRSSIVPTNTQQIQYLQMNIIQMESQRDSLTAQNVDPNSSAVISLRAKIVEAQKQLQSLQSQLNQQTNDGRPISEVVGSFEKLNLDLQYAQQLVISTEQALDQARANAAAQHLYLTPYVEPQLVTQSDEYPRRTQNTILSMLSFFALWMISVLMYRAVLDHSV